MEHKKSPQSAAEQDSPQQERMVTPQEEAGMDLQQMKQPPQAEGQREVQEEQVGDEEQSR